MKAFWAPVFVVACLSTWVATATETMTDPTMTAENGEMRLMANDVIFAFSTGGELRASELSAQMPQLSARVTRQAETIAATANLVDTSLGPRVTGLEAQIATLLETVAGQAVAIDRLLGDQTRARARIRNLELRLEIVETLANATGAELRELRQHFSFPVGRFTTVATVVKDATELQAWRDSDVEITTNSCLECVQSFPMYLHGAGGRTSYATELATVRSFLAYRYPSRWPVDQVRPKSDLGKLNGRALFKQSNMLRGETDTAGCTSYIGGLCTGAAVNEYEVYTSPILSAAPTQLQAPATANVSVPNDDAAFDLVQQWSLEAVVRVQLSAYGQDPDRRLPNRVTYMYPIIEKTARVGLNEDTFALRVSFDGVDPFLFSAHTCLERATDGDDFCVSTKRHFSVNNWIHLVAVYDGNVLSLYADGKLEVSAVIGAVIAYTGPAPLSIGSNRYTNHGGLGTFVGLIDEIRIWRVALTAAHIVATANTVFVTPTDAALLAQLVAAYDFEQDSDTPDLVKDLAAEGRHGVVANAIWVAGRHPNTQALYFMDDGHPMTFFPQLPENDWVAFVPPAQVRCTWGESCTCSDAILSTYRVYRGEVRPRLLPGTYAICHAPAASLGREDAVYIWQSHLTVTSAEADPCFGVDCGRYGQCDSITASCSCEPGWTGSLCESKEAPVAANGNSPYTAAPSCRAIYEAYPDQVDNGLFYVTLGDVASPRQVWCDMKRKGWTVLAQYTPSTVSAEDFLKTYLRAGPLGGVVDKGAPTMAGSPTAYTRVAREDSYTEVVVGCWRVGDNSPLADSLVIVPRPWIGTKLLAGLIAASEQTTKDGSYTQFLLATADVDADALAAVFWSDTSSESTFAVRQNGPSLCGSTAITDSNQLVLMVR